MECPLQQTNNTFLSLYMLLELRWRCVHDYFANLHDIQKKLSLHGLLVRELVAARLHAIVPLRAWVGFHLICRLSISPAMSAVSCTCFTKRGWRATKELHLLRYLNDIAMTRKQWKSDPMILESGSALQNPPENLPERWGGTILLITVTSFLYVPCIFMVFREHPSDFTEPFASKFRL